MKKITLIYLLIQTMFTATLFGQDTLKAVHNKWLTELNVNLFQGQITLNNAINQVKVRYMLSNNQALRIGFIFSSNKKTDDSEQVYGTSPYKENEDLSTSFLGINAGFEKHFTGTKRLTPYIGAELSIGKKWSKSEIETNTLKTTIDGAWRQVQYYSSGNYYYYSTTYSERAYFSYGLNIVTGFDFYMAKNLFVGYEVMFGYQHIKYDNVDVTYSGTDSSNQTAAPNYKSKESSFGPKVLNGIRIGYVF